MNRPLVFDKHSNVIKKVMIRKIIFSSIFLFIGCAIAIYLYKILYPHTRKYKIGIILGSMISGAMISRSISNIIGTIIMYNIMGKFRIEKTSQGELKISGKTGSKQMVANIKMQNENTF